MKRLVALAAWVGLLHVPAFAQQSLTNTPLRIRASEARRHLDANAVVYGKIAEVNHTARIVRLNFDRPFPNQPFTAVIFPERTNLFSHLHPLEGRMVEVSGKISTYQGRPQIILTDTNQLKVLEPPTATGSGKK